MPYFPFTSMRIAWPPSRVEWVRTALNERRFANRKYGTNWAALTAAFNDAYGTSITPTHIQNKIKNDRRYKAASESHGPVEIGRVYVLWVPDGDALFYVGHTTMSLSDRLSDHRTKARQPDENAPVYRYLRKHSDKNILISSLEECKNTTTRELLLCEQRWMESMAKSHRLLNAEYYNPHYLSS